MKEVNERKSNVSETIEVPPGRAAATVHSHSENPKHLDNHPHLCVPILSASLPNALSMPK